MMHIFIKRQESYKMMMRCTAALLLVVVVIGWVAHVDAVDCR
jgi:hypothetical protein